MTEIKNVSDLFHFEHQRLMRGNTRGNAIMTGFERLDNLTDGFDGGSLITIGGRTAMGKTTLAINIAHNVASKGLPVLYVNLESTDEQFIDKFLSCSTGIELDSIRNGLLTKEGWGSLDQEAANIQSLPIFIDSRPTATIDQLCEDITKVAREQNIKLVFIDYLQLMYTKVSASSDNRYGDLNYYTRRLKSLAKELNLPIIIVSQLNRNVEKDKNSLSIDDYRPTLTDLRDSGTICDDSDVVIFLYRPEYYQIYEDDKGFDMRGKAILIVAKNRFGYTGDVMLDCQLGSVRFTSPKSVNETPEIEPPF